MENLKETLTPYADYILFALKWLPLLILFIGAMILVRYIINNHIIKLYIAKIKGNISEQDRIRSANIRRNVGLTSLNEKTKLDSIKALREELDSIYQKEPSKYRKFITKVKKQMSSTLYYSGLEEKGFSITSALILLVLCASVTGVLVGMLTTAFLGIFSGLFIIVAVYYSLVIKTKIKREALESQLYSFIGAVAQASVKYTGLIDIFGDISNSLEAPLGPALRKCYAEAKQTYNETIALNRLKDNFNSEQFSFIIDSFNLCSRMTGNYRETAEDISETIEIYVNNMIQKQEMYRIGRIRIHIIAGACVGITYILTFFMNGVMNTILHTPVGNLLLLLFIIVASYGATMRVRR